MQILVVEDERMLAESLKEILEKNGHTVQLSYDGQDGLEMAKTVPFDLLLLDLMPPKRKNRDSYFNAYGKIGYSG